MPTSEEIQAIRETELRTKRVFDFIVKHKRLCDGNAPSYKEIMEATGVTSLSMVKYHLNLLIKAGKIRTRSSLKIHSRSIEVVGGQWFYKDES